MQRKKRGSLRFLAASCVFTAWLTLIVSVILAGFSLVSGFAASQAVAALPAPSTEYFPTPAPSTQAPGLEDLGLPSPGNILGGGAPSPAGGGLAGMMTMFRTVVPFLYFGSAAFTVVTGVITFLLFLGLGQACYAILDLEDQAVRNEQTLQLILARLSGGR